MAIPKFTQRLLLLLFFTAFLLGPGVTIACAQSTQYVINRFGTPLRTSANVTSDTITLLKPGEALSVQPSFTAPDSVRYDDNNITLAGFWLLVDSKGQKGYVFSADLSYNEPVISASKSYNMDIYEVNILGLKVDSSVVKKQVEYSPGNMVDYTDDHFQYEYGRSVETWFDGCLNTEFILDGWQLNNAFHLLRNEIYSDGMLYGKEFYIDTPRLIEYSNFEYKFEISFGASQDIVIKYDKERNETWISYASCT
ncbi:SH3 domain-containing protein [Roseivirga misakiensis]|uniref:hypothetical protein n=1 Tax=Roseivirga misakiensis TaxID=1563681 RepID=UPI00114CAC16|nr:hypothetical protein [Roseivirga misakiensis]